MSSSGEHTADALKKGWAKFHGAGEALRGNVNAFADAATGDDPTRNQNVAARGVDEIETGRYAGTGAGVTPKDTAREKVNREVQGEGVRTGMGAGGVGAGAVAGERGHVGTGHHSTVGGAGAGTGGAHVGPGVGHHSTMGSASVGPGGAHVGPTGASAGPGGAHVGPTGASAGPGGASVGANGPSAGPGGASAGRGGPHVPGGHHGGLGGAGV